MTEITSPMGTPSPIPYRLRRPHSSFVAEQAADYIEQIEAQLASAERRIEDKDAALGQASFCLRELLPNDEDAKMTVRMIDRALAKSKHS